MKDSHIRSILKGISWRILATLTTVFLAILLFDDVKKALAIGGTEVLAKVLLYYFHERIWNSFDWGRLKDKASHLRSVSKGFSWRLIASSVTIVIAISYTGKFLGSLSLGFFEATAKIFLYYLHERLWNLIAWGRIYIPSTSD